MTLTFIIHHRDAGFIVRRRAPLASHCRVKPLIATDRGFSHYAFTVPAHKTDEFINNLAHPYRWARADLLAHKVWSEDENRRPIVMNPGSGELPLKAFDVYAVHSPLTRDEAIAAIILESGKLVDVSETVKSDARFPSQLVHLRVTPVTEASPAAKVHTRAVDILKAERAHDAEDDDRVNATRFGGGHVA